MAFSDSWERGAQDQLLFTKPRHRSLLQRWVAPVARLGATGVASPQEVTNLADRSLDEDVPSRWVEWFQVPLALPPSQRILCVLSPLREDPKIVFDMQFQIHQPLGRSLREVGQRDWNGLTQKPQVFPWESNHPTPTPAAFHQAPEAAAIPNPPCQSPPSCS